MYVDYEITVTDKNGNTVLRDKSPKAANKAIETHYKASTLSPSSIKSPFFDIEQANTLINYDVETD